MSAPRLVIDLDKIEHNARTLLARLAQRGIEVTGVTKAALGSPEIPLALLRAGVCRLGHSRIESIEALRREGVAASLLLIRSPMLSQVDRVVAHADVSFNTELAILARLSAAAGKAGLSHGIVLMVELGDLREGILPDDLEDMVRQTLALPHLVLRGIGTNLACRSGVAPDAHKMAELSALATSIEATFGLSLDIVSGGNSANLNWAFSDTKIGRINDLRLGEAILLGVEPLNRQPVDGLHSDAITLVAEVIESKIKPSLPWGKIAQAAFGEAPPAIDRGPLRQTILAIGRQDVDPEGLTPPPGMTILGASSDHLVIDCGKHAYPVGSEIEFEVNYSALVRAMTSPFVSREWKRLQ